MNPMSDEVRDILTRILGLVDDVERLECGEKTVDGMVRDIQLRGAGLSLLDATKKIRAAVGCG